MVDPFEVRFQRALSELRPDWEKWDFDPAEYPLLRQIQDGQTDIFARSFTFGGMQFHVDYLKLGTPGAYTFADREETTVFVGLTRVLVEELLELARVLASSEDVRNLIGLPGPPLADGQFTDILFFLALQFMVGHEAGHYVRGHITDRTLWFESSEPALLVNKAERLRQQAEELEADAYAIHELCRNLIGGDAGTELVAMLPPGGTYCDEQVLTLVAIAVTGVFLAHLKHHRPTVNYATGCHPPPVLRHHRIMDAMRDWATAHGKPATAITGAGHHAIMHAVANAIPADLRPRWNEQVDRLESAAGKQYLNALETPEG